MYQIPAEAIFEFQKLYQKHYGKKLSKRQAIKEIRDILIYTGFLRGQFLPIGYM